jgi:hypothetical protein
MNEKGERKMKTVSTLLIASFIFVSMFSAIAPKIRAETAFPRPSLPDGLGHSNELSNLISASTTKVLIVTEGYGPLTGVSPMQDKILWQEVLSQMSDFYVDWYDGIPTLELLDQYSLVIYDAGGYWYPLSNSASSLRGYHFSGKPLIVVAPDVNYDWGMGSLDPAFVQDVLHIEGVLGILPEVQYDLHAGTGNVIESSLPENIQVPAGTSWPDCFDPENDAECALVNKYVVTTEFGVGTAADLPSYSVYTPLGYYTIVAYPGSSSEGKVVTIGVPVAGFPNAIAEQLCSNIIEWSLGTLSSKKRLIQELYALNEETDKAIDSQVDTLARLHTTAYLGTYQDPAWALAKIALGFLAGVYSKDFLMQNAPFLWKIVGPLSEYHVLDAYRAKKIYDALEEVYNGLDPSFGEENIRNRFKSKLLACVAVDSSDSIDTFKTALDTRLQSLINKLEQMPDEDGYDYMASEVKRIREWTTAIQNEENTIRYIDIVSDKVIEARTVGGLAGYSVRLEQELEHFKTEATINDVAAFTIIAGVLIKIVGWAFAVKTLGIGTIVTVKTESVGSGMMAAGGLTQTASSVAKDLTKAQATAIIECEATPMLINDVEAIGDVYYATLNLVENWDQKGEYSGECTGLLLDQDTYVLDPLDVVPFDGDDFISLFQADISGFVALSSSQQATGRIVLEVFQQESDVLQAIIGNSELLPPCVCVMMPFKISLFDFLTLGQYQKIYRVVAYSAVGTTLYGPFVKVFRVVREGVCVGVITSESYSSSIGTGQSYSEVITSEEGTSSLYISLDYPGSDLDLHLFDSENRHVGMDYATGQTEIGIPNAQYSGWDANPEWISIEGDVGIQDFLLRVACVYAEGQESFSLSCTSISFPSDTTPPTTVLEVGSPKFVDADHIYITSGTPFTLEAQDNIGGTGVASANYRVYNATYDTGWFSTSPPIEFCLTGLEDGEYSIDYYSTDNIGNTEPKNTTTVILDNTPPTTPLTIGEPKYISDTTYVTPDTPFTLEATDTGSGVYSTAYRIYNATYDSGWQTYTAPFKLTSLTDGTYTIEYNSTDNVKNTETTHAINVTLFSWNYIYQDTYGRGTTLKINLAHKFFQFITPKKDYGIRKATRMKQCGRAIIIEHCDKQLRLITISVDTKTDFCYAMAWDMQTRKCYLLIDKVGIEK